MYKVYLSLGSNLGNRMENLSNAVKKLHLLGNHFCYSSIYKTDPWGFESTEEFLNMALSFETAICAEDLLPELLSIEQQLGRVRYCNEINYESRTIDIDILFFGNQIINNTELRIPHPLLQDRKFVLIPLNEIASELIHPVNNKSIKELLFDCKDVCTVIFNSKFVLL